MAWPSVRLWRVCMVGIGVCRRWCTVCMALVYGAMACVGTVYGVQALGVRCAGVGWVRCTVLWRWVYVCMSFYDVT